MFFIITTCHECLRDKAFTSTPSVSSKSKNDADEAEETSVYQGPSPDEVALLNAAKKIGFEFVSTENKVTTVLYNSKEYKFKMLRVVEFNSDRKRMTVVVESKGVVFTFVKGADSAIRSLLSPNQKYL
jgi:magnesium-transporting ATPase (P-type)